MVVIDCEMVGTGLQGTFQFFGLMQLRQLQQRQLCSW